MLLALAIGLLAGSSGATAQTLDQQWTYCVNKNKTYALDLVIGGCTGVIQSGREATANLAIAFYNRGAAYSAQKDTARAIADYDQAIRLNPQSAVAFNNRGNVYQYGPQHDYARAIADYDQAIALNPRYTEAYDNRGSAHSAQRDYVRAIADYDQAGTLDATNGVYQNNRCWARALANRELDVARAACDAALRITPNAAGRLDSRGMVGLKQQRWQDAWNDYDAAARADATIASIFYGRGIAALRLGRIADSEADLARAASLDAKIAQTYASYGVTP